MDPVLLPDSEARCLLQPEFELEFSAQVSPAQELIGAPPVPLTTAQLPVSPVIGDIALRFAPDLSSVEFRLNLFGVVNPANLNEAITQAHLHAGRANENGPIIATLVRFADLDEAGVQVNGLLAEGVLRNVDITPVSSPSGLAFNSIASLYNGIRAREVYVNVHGSSFDGLKPSFASGIARGQIFPQA